MSWVLLKNSLLVAGGTAFAATAFGAVVAVWLNAMPIAWRRAVLAASAVGLALPPFLVTNCWLDLLGRAGVWRAWLPINIYSLWGTVWVLTLLLWPVALFFVLGSLQKLEASQLESDAALRGWPVFRWLLAPLAWPSLVLAGVLIFVLALNNFAVPAILQTKVFPAEIWVSFNTTFDYASTVKLSWPLVVFPLLLLVMLRGGNVVWPRVAGGASSRLFRERIGALPFVVSGIFSGVVLLLGVAVPLGQLLISGRTWIDLPDAFAAGREAILNSFIFAGVTASCCGLLGIVCWRWRVAAALWILYLMPGVLLGIAIIFALNRGSLAAFYQSAGVVVLALGLKYAAVSWAGAHRAMGALDTRLADFARLNGASAWQMLRYVRWPQIAPSLTALWFVTYLLCLWDVETLILIIPPGCETLALRVFNLLHYGHNAQVNALCVLLLGLAVLPLVAWTLVELGRRRAVILVAVTTALAGAGCDRGPSDGTAVKSALFSGVQVIGARGAALGQFSKPRSLAVDAQDNLYVVDMTGRVQKFASNGTFVSSWQMPQTDLGKPKGMCRDAAGNIVVVEPHYTRVSHFSPEGALVARWGCPGTNEGQLCLPRAVAADRGGNILVCEYTLVDRVQKFSPLGERWILAFGKSGRGDGAFNRPEGVSVDAQDRIYVADSCNHRVQVFSPEGKFLRSYGRAGNGVGQLSYPYDVQVDAAGLQFVAEFGNSRVQVFDERGASVEILGGAGAAPGQFSNPWSLALDSAGNLYVADSQNHRVQKFLRKSPLVASGRAAPRQSP